MFKVKQNLQILEILYTVGSKSSIITKSECKLSNKQNYYYEIFY